MILSTVPRVTSSAFGSEEQPVLELVESIHPVSIRTADVGTPLVKTPEGVPWLKPESASL
jgi:hypothetical protein